MRCQLKIFCATIIAIVVSAERAPTQGFFKAKILGMPCSYGAPNIESEPVLRRLLSLSPGAKEFAANMMKKYLNR